MEAAWIQLSTHPAPKTTKSTRWQMSSQDPSHLSQLGAQNTTNFKLFISVGRNTNFQKHFFAPAYQWAWREASVQREHRHGGDADEAQTKSPPKSKSCAPSVQVSHTEAQFLSPSSPERKGLKARQHRPQRKCCFWDRRKENEWCYDTEGRERK